MIDGITPEAPRMGKLPWEDDDPRMGDCPRMQIRKLALALGHDQRVFMNMIATIGIALCSDSAITFILHS